MIETFTIVAFRYDQKRSVLYQNKDDPQAIARMVLKALIDEKADVISIRRVMEKHPEQLEVKRVKELTKEDCMNIRKWVNATGMLIQAKMRTTWSQSELDTWEKIKRIEQSLEV